MNSYDGLCSLQGTQKYVRRKHHKKILIWRRKIYLFGMHEVIHSSAKHHKPCENMFWGKKIHQCPECSKSFEYKSKLDRHLKYHTSSLAKKQKNVQNAKHYLDAVITSNRIREFVSMVTIIRNLYHLSVVLQIIHVKLL